MNIDEPLAESRSGTTSYYEQDGLGSVTTLSNSSGSVAESYTYDSFGNLTASTGSLTNPFRYTGREFDAETSLYYYRARYYDPNSGRFLSEDRIKFEGGMNFYEYVSNHVTDLVDPLGLLQVCCRPAHQSWVMPWARLTAMPAPCHCFLRLSNGDTLGGYFDRSIRGLGNLTLAPNDKTDHDKYAPEAKCSDVPGQPCESDARARIAFDSLPKTLGAYGLGDSSAGTSNDAASQILRTAGFDDTLPLCAWSKSNNPNSGMGTRWYKRIFQ